MPTQQKLELTWTGTEKQPRLEPRVRLELAEDPPRDEAPRRCYEAALSICPQPRCRCLNIWFEWWPAAAEALPAPHLPAHEFWFDLQEKSAVLTPELEKDPVARRLAEILRTELTEADQQQLREWFLASKLQCIQTTPIPEIDLADLPEADVGRMVGFVEVFPCGLALTFTWNQDFWAVDEQYCVQPGCKCKETVLTFLKLKDATGTPTTTLKDPPALRYNYHTGAMQRVARGATGSPSLDGLLAALQREQPSLNSQLELRHLIMQSLYGRHYLARSNARLQSLSTLASSSVSPRIGRNEPCPCGSGRKYKHCCLNQDRP